MAPSAVTCALEARGRSLSGPLLAFVLLGACRAGGASPRSQGPGPVPPPAAPLSHADTEPAFRALQAALAEGEDEVALRILPRLRARALGAAERALLDSAERVLAGRALVRELELALASEPLPEREGSYRLVLLARSRATHEVRLLLPPCDLKRLRSSMDSRGVEGLQYESRACAALSDLALAPGGETRLELLTYDLPLGRALAARERWRVETRAGEIECGGVRYPAQSVPVAGCERERLSSRIAAEHVPATALARRLEEQDPPRSRELLELALRTAECEREPALRALAPVVARLAHSSPERLAAAEPALRWLTQNRELGLDAEAWARYLGDRAAASRAAANPPAGALDLPERPPRAARQGEAG
jgi:hypothetical protein